MFPSQSSANFLPEREPTVAATVGAAFPEEGPLPPNAHANVGARNPHLGHSASDFGFSVEFHFLAHVSNHLQIFACDFLC